MGGSAKVKAVKKAKQEDKAAGTSNAPLPTPLLLLIRAVWLLLTLATGYVVSTIEALHSSAEKKTHVFIRILYCIVAQNVAGEFFCVLFLQLGRRLVGEPDSGLEVRSDELIQNDPSIPWPRADLLSPELRPFLSKKGQPFFLNHVTARQRCKDACMRIGMAVGSTLAIWCTCRWMEHRSLASIGLTLDAPFFSEISVGLCVGISIVGFMFVVELCFGWLHFLEFFEVFDKSERFSTCIFWDVVFHISVAINEELPVRGWMLYSLSDAFAAHVAGLTKFNALLLAMVLQSVFFVAMHLSSPGGSRILSMVNIFVGGMAGGLNVLFTGGRLGFALGWHFGWNISMGNVFGLSTSGIPISGTFAAVAPHPEKESLHGGVFGPEGGVVSPVAYGLGIVMLAMAYGFPSQQL